MQDDLTTTAKCKTDKRNQFATMMRVQRRKLFLTFLAVIGAFIILNFIATFLKEMFGRVTTCLDNSHIRFNGSGSIDTASRWRKLGLATYVFTAYLDDREPCSAVVAVMGFGEKSEPSLYGILLFRNGTKIRLGKCKEKKVFNPTGFYTLGKLGPYGYLWLLPAEVTSGSDLSSFIVQQTHPVTGKTEVEIPITIPVYSTRTFGVCIHSPLFGPVSPQSIIENIEINKILGAEWFTFYIYSADQNALQVLREYAREGTVEVVMNWGNDPPGQSTHYFGQTLSISECAYRNMRRVKYLVYADLDEFIVPRQSLGWAEMMGKIENFKFGTYLFRHTFFFANNDTDTERTTNEVEFVCNVNGGHRIELPKFLTRTIRSRKVNPPKQRSKCITMPLYTSLIGVHEVFEHVGEYIKTYVVPPDFALLHHYRLFRGGLHPVSSSVIEDVKHQTRILDERAFVYKEKIIAALRTRLCPAASYMPVGNEGRRERSLSE